MATPPLKGSGLHSISSMVTGTVLGHALTVLSAPLLTRLYGPPDFGALAVYVALLSLLSSVVCFKYELAISIAASDAEAANAVALSAASTLLLSAVCAGAVVLFRDDVARITGAPGLAPFLWLVPIGLLATGLDNALSLWVARRGRYAGYARSRATVGLSQATTQLGLGALGVVPGGLFAGDLLSRWSAVGTLAAASWRLDRGPFGAVSRRAVLQVARRYKRFPLLGSWGAMLNRLALEAPVLMLATYYSIQVTGDFALMHRVLALPLAFLGQAVGMYYVGEGAHRLRRSPGALRDFFQGTTLRLALFGALPLALAGLLGPWLVPRVFGAAWQEAGRYALAMSAMAAIQLAVVPVSQTLNLLERQDLQLAWDAGRGVLVVAVLGTAGALGVTPLSAIIAYCAAMSLAYLALLALAVRALRAAQAQGTASVRSTG